jgi:hypothetical protein
LETENKGKLTSTENANNNHESTTAVTVENDNNAEQKTENNKNKPDNIKLPSKLEALKNEEIKPK